MDMTRPNDIDRLFERLSVADKASLVQHLNSRRERVVWVDEEFVGVHVTSKHLEVKTKRNYWSTGVKKDGTQTTT